ncbi:PDZ domain-containing protein [Oceanicaulis sp. LC35]|uniref:S41 family peptidase n=1 Tax=Oceanicaulis sp. LC35 TaxID=3349635 RepID=UPI003F874318
MKHLLGGVCAAALGLFASTASAQDDQTLLLRTPAVHGDTLVFVYAGDLWRSELDGRNPVRLTSHAADERAPHISPDGRWVAFTADYEDNQDVYVMPVAGGQPQRLTWHPGNDRVTGWSPDGRVLFTSHREVNHGRSDQLWSIAPGEGYPRTEMEARFVVGDMNADGRIVYNPTRTAHSFFTDGGSGWRIHRGGSTGTISILSADRQDSALLESDRINEFFPIWVGDQVYYLSDEDGEQLALYRYDPETGARTRLHDEAPWDIRWMDSDGQTLVFEAGGRLKRYDVATGQVSEIRISLNADLPQLAPRWVNAARTITHAALSPTGQRALITARGEVFSAPLDEGSTRNVSNTSGVREYTALWSPDGDQVAYITDAGGAQQLTLVDQRGFEAPRTLALGGAADAFYALEAWAPETNRIIYSDNLLNLYALNVQTGRSVRLATEVRRSGYEVAVSPDGRWLAYTLEQANFLRDLVLHNLLDGTQITVSDGMADVGAPAFSRDGAYLYFTASTNVGPQQVGLNMQTRERPSRYGLYAAVLAADGVSPLLPGTGDENAAGADEEPEDGESDAVVVTRVDAAGLSDRIVALPVSERNYGNLAVDKQGGLLFVDYAQPGAEYTPPGESPSAQNRLMRFDFEEKDVSELSVGVDQFLLSADGGTILVQRNEGGWAHSETGESLELEALDTSGMRLRVDPRAEWAHIFDEVWRMEASYFYDPDLHGLDWQGVRDRYEPLLAHVGRREDLNALMVDMIGEFQVGHNRTGGGDVHHEQGVSGGLLGADFALEGGRYRIARIYSGEAWNPFLNGPLAAPGLDVSEGDFILAINGQPLTASDNIHALLQGTVDAQTTLTIADTARGANPRDIVVEPISSESQLRLWGWIEANRAAVDQATDGRVGYIYLPNTAGAGYDFFNRMYYAQANKQALIFDERSNGGGQAADYITDVLSPFHLSGWISRGDQLPYNTPFAAHYGPKVMMIDQDAGSGGDFLPYSFRRREIGPLIGTRTWGGLIGISANPDLMDGGSLVVPFFRFYTADGEWRVENEGVAPDIEVYLDPVATNAGRDNQLERAIAETEQMMASQTAPSVPLTAPEAPDEVGQ